MARKARRATAAPRLEALEARALLSADPLTTVGVWGVPASPSPAHTVLTKFAASTPPQQVDAELAAVGGRLQATEPDGDAVVALAPWVSPATAAAALRAEPGVAYAEVDSTYHAAGLVIPNDPLAIQQWSLADVDANSAWGVTEGTPLTIVAVLDTGIDLGNADFAGRIWVNPSPAANDGYGGRDLYGWNYVSNSPNVQDNNGHGSHVSGILAATGNNATGIAGIDWGARIMALKVLDANGDGSTDAAVSAIYYAVQHGARVINASWGGDDFSQAFLDALNYADSKGVVFVTAAGNESADNDITASYPASYRTPNELVVAATDQINHLADFSNYGGSTVDLAAPGVGILSIIPGGFAVYDGTSMSTPFVAGTVALVEGVHPDWNAEQLVADVVSTVKPVAALNGLLIDPGVVDPYYALLGHNATSGGGTVKVTSTPRLTPGASAFDTVERAFLATDSIYSLTGGTPSAYVNGVYQAVFGRPATAGESSYYTAAIAAGLSRTALIQKLQAAPEAASTKVARWYQDELGSTATVAALKSDAGVAFWAAMLTGGAADADVQALLLSNDGRYAAVGNSAAAYVNSLYQALLGRPAEAGGQAYYVAELAAGTTRAALARQILASPEGHAATIARLYRDELGSTTSIAALETDAGVNYWAAYLGSD